MEYVNDPIQSGKSYAAIRKDINNNMEYLKKETDSIPDQINNSILFGTYTGTGSGLYQEINLGTRPKAVVVYTESGGQVYGPKGIDQAYGGLAIDGCPCKQGSDIAIEITDRGFKVYSEVSNGSARYVFANNRNEKYYYMAYLCGTIRG